MDGGRPFGGARAVSGELNTYLDISKIPGCRVTYLQPSKRGPPIHSRPLWRNNSNPFQYDRNYLARGDIARGEMANRQAKDRMSTTDSSPSPLSVTGWSQIWTSSKDDPPLMTRSASSPTAFQKVYTCQALGDSNKLSRLQGGDEAAQFGISKHIPGYSGFLPGLVTYNNEITLARTFGKATSNMGQFRSTGRSDRAGNPLPWVSRQMNPAATA